MAIRESLGPMSRPVYLESLDSVRPHWISPGTDASGQHSNELMVLLEAISVLAMGDQIVVPQSYAIDSGAFLTLVDRLIPVSGKDHPIGVRLFGRPSLDAAAAAILARMTTEGSFDSSLYPEISSGEWVLTEMTLPGLIRLLSSRDQKRADRLRLVKSTFEDSAHEYGTSTRQLPERIGTLYQYLRDRAFDAVAESLGEAIAKLTHPQAFTNRSLIRMDKEWIEGGKQSAREILGNDDQWELMIEVVDTLYNRVVAESLRIPHVVLSTPPGVSSHRRAARALAQQFALDSDLQQPAAEQVGETRTSSMFEYGVTIANLTEKTFGRVARTLMDSGRIDTALTSLMAARGDKGGPFWPSVAEIRRAHWAGDPEWLATAMALHHELVSRLMGGDIRVTNGNLLGSAVRVAEATTAATLGVGASALAGGGAPNWVTLSAAIGAAVVPIAAAEAFIHHPRTSQVAATRTALTEVIQPAGRTNDQ